VKSVQLAYLPSSLHTAATAQYVIDVILGSELLTYARRVDNSDNTSSIKLWCARLLGCTAAISATTLHCTHLGLAGAQQQQCTVEAQYSCIAVHDQQPLDVSLRSHSQGHKSACSSSTADRRVSCSGVSAAESTALLLQCRLSLCKQDCR
jgi:hypothetical protein